MPAKSGFDCESSPDFSLNNGEHGIPMIIIGFESPGELPFQLVQRTITLVAIGNPMEQKGAAHREI